MTHLIRIFSSALATLGRLGTQGQQLRLLATLSVSALLSTGVVWAFPPRCPVPVPRSHACGTMVCDQTNKIWLEQALPAGQSCNHGQGTCDGAEVTCQCTNSLDAHTVILYPHFLVVGLLYAPPGCTTSATLTCTGATSSVTYSNGSTLQTTTSVSGSFSSDVKESTNVSATPGVEIKDLGGFAVKIGFGTDSDFTTTDTSTSTVTVSKSASTTFTLPGGNDGIDHSQDTFILLLNPAVVVTELQEDTGKGVCSLVRRVEWTPGLSNKGPTHSDSTADLQQITVAEVLDPSLMDAHKTQVLKNAGATPEDLKALLALDPFATGASNVDTTRFLPTMDSFGYDARSNCATSSQTLSNIYQGTLNDTAATSYSVTFSESQGFTTTVLPTIFNFGSQVDRKTTFTNSVSQSTSNQSTQTATFLLGCPSPAFPGATVQVFWDTLFGSFMFASPTLSPRLRPIQTGRLLHATGQGAAREPVVLKYHGKVYRTTSRSDGSYAFYSVDRAAPGSSASLVVAGRTRVVTAGQPAPTVIRIP